MRQIPTFLHFLPKFPGFALNAGLYSRQEGQLRFAYLWNFRTVGSMRLQW
jgi:hypothetical protein